MASEVILDVLSPWGLTTLIRIGPKLGEMGSVSLGAPRTATGLSSIAKVQGPAINISWGPGAPQRGRRLVDQLKWSAFFSVRQPGRAQLYRNFKPQVSRAIIRILTFVGSNV